MAIHSPLFSTWNLERSCQLSRKEASWIGIMFYLLIHLGKGSRWMMITKEYVRGLAPESVNEIFLGRKEYLQMELRSWDKIILDYPNGPLIQLQALFIRHRKEDIAIQKWRTYEDVDRCESYTATSQEFPGATRSWKRCRRIVLYRLQRECYPVNILILGYCPLKLWENTFL